MADNTKNTQGTQAAKTAPGSSKFMFDNCFDVPSSTNGSPARPTSEREKAVLEQHNAELEQTRELAFQEGLTFGVNQTKGDIDAAVAGLLENLASGWAEAFSLLDAHFRLRRAESVKAANMIGQRLAPGLMAKYPLSEIESALDKLLPDLSNEPRLVIRIPELLVKPLGEYLEPVSERNAFVGKLVILGDDAMGPHDWRIEWSDGGAEYNFDAATNHIDDLVSDSIQAIYSEPLPQVDLVQPDHQDDPGPGPGPEPALENLPELDQTDSRLEPQT